MDKHAKLATVKRTCATCGKLFYVEPWEARKNPCRYCSPACNGEARKGFVVNPERRAEIVRLYRDEGRSVDAIAAQVGLARASVYRHLSRAGVPVIRKAGRLRISCHFCHKEFEDKRSRIERWHRKYCSMQCFHRERTMDLSERFWPKVDTSGDCWLWGGSVRPNGYGQLSSRPGQAPLKAHRVAYELTYGPIPKGMKVCHRCDVNYPLGDLTYRRCVNPNHLWLGTQAENLQDMIAKGRGHWQRS